MPRAEGKEDEEKGEGKDDEAIVDPLVSKFCEYCTETAFEGEVQQFYEVCQCRDDALGRGLGAVIGELRCVSGLRRPR